MIYICHTAYHVFVSCIRQMTDPSSDCSIMLSDTLPNMKSIASRLAEAGVFQRVYTLNHDEILPRFCQNSYHKTLLISPLYLQKMNTKLSFLLNEELYLFNDYSEVGIFLVLRKKTYHLLEDSKDTFASAHAKPSGRQRKMKELLNRIFHVPYSIGMTNYCIDIAVNNKEKVKTHFNFPIKEYRIDKAIDQLSPEEKKTLIDIFGLPTVSDSSLPKAIVLTQPLAEMRKVNNDAETVIWYEQRIKQYYPAYKIYIKPHPRDKSDYSKLFNGDVWIIDRAIPSEMLNFGDNIHFDLALTYTSTSVNGLKCCDEVRLLR